MHSSGRYSYRSLGLSLCAAVLLAACGGGGGGGGGSPDTPVVYAGNTNAAVISPTNASKLTADIISSDASANVIGGLAARGDADDAGPSTGQVDLARRLSRVLRNAVLGTDASGRVIGGVQIDQTDPCEAGSGSVRTSGTLNDATLTGTLNVAFNNCLSNGVVLNGNATQRVDLFDFGYFVPVDSTLSFTRLTLRGTGISVDATGSLRMQLNIPANRETDTESLVSLDNNTGLTTKSENLSFQYTYDNIFSPTSSTITVLGRVFDPVHGFIDVVTNAPLFFGTLNQIFPEGGQFTLVGEGSRRVRATALSALLAKLELDLDGDSLFEHAATLKWSDLSGPVGADLGDDDGDGMHNSWETANGLNPNNAADAGMDADSDGRTNLEEYKAGTNPNVADPAPPPPPPPPPGAFPAQVVSLPDNSALIYDPVTQKLYAAVRGNPGAVVPIDPATGALGTSIAVGINPIRLARSDNGQYLYVGLDGESAIQRIDLTLPTPAVDLTIPLGNGSLGPLFAEDLAVLPGSPQSIAVSLRYQGFSPRHQGVAVFDDAVRRATVTPGHTGSNAIEFSASAGTLYGYNNETTEFGFRRMAVDASGVTVLDVHDSFHASGALISGFSVDIKFHAGLIYATSGRVIDPVARTLVGTLNPLPGIGVLVEPDTANGRVFTLAFDSAVSSWVVRAYDSTSLTLLGSEVVAGTSGDHGNLLRWGTRGLAFRNNGGQILVTQSSALLP